MKSEAPTYYECSKQRDFHPCYTYTADENVWCVDCKKLVKAWERYTGAKIPGRYHAVYQGG